MYESPAPGEDKYEGKDGECNREIKLWMLMRGEGAKQTGMQTQGEVHV